MLLCTLMLATIALRLRFEAAGVSLEEKAQEMYSRVMRMHEACARIPPQRHLKALVQGRRHFYLSERFSLSYCEVPSASSTYWAQVFMALAGINPKFHDYDDAKSIFDLPKSIVHDAIRQQSGLVMEKEDKRVKLTTTFLVARNPYSRLFSAYIDQIYLPLNWNAARRMIQNDQVRQECGSGVSFNEFLYHVSDAVLKKKRIDIRWAPIFSVCLPCETDINMVVKQETLPEDAEFLLAYIGAEDSVRDQARNASVKTISEKEIRHFVKKNVESGHSVDRGCISESALAKKIWTALQIKGHIDDNFIFPEEGFKEVFREDLESTLIAHVLEAIKASQMPYEAFKKQRRKWKLDFWKQVSKTTMINVQAAYFEDFSLFQYDIDPHNM